MRRMIVAGAAAAALTVSGLAGVVATQRAEAAPQACARANDEVRVVTANIRSLPLMPIGHVKDDMAKVSRAGGDVLMWQEITPQNYKKALSDLSMPDGRGGHWRHFHTKMSNPISVRVGGDSPWEVVDSGHELMHGGRAKVSPNRYIHWVVLKDRSSGRKTVFMNTHMVSGAWNGKDDRDDAWRKDRWNEHHQKQKARIEAFVKAGHSVVYGGDFNRRGMGKLHPKDERIMTGGIDYVGVVLGGGDKLERVTERESISLHSDHNARSVKAVVSGCRRSAPPTGPTKTPTGKPTKTPTKTPTKSGTPTASASPLPTASETPAPTPTGSQIPVPTPKAPPPATPRATQSVPPESTRAPETPKELPEEFPKDAEGGLANTGG